MAIPEIRISEGIQFIYDHELQIRGNVSGPKIEHLEGALSGALGDEPSETAGPNLKKAILDILTEFRTGLYVHRKPQAGGSKVLIAADNPGAYGATKGMITELIDDPRCKDLSVLVSGSAHAGLVTDFKDILTPVPPIGGSILATLLDSTKEGPYDIAFATVNSQNGPELPLLFGGKSNLGDETTRLYLIAEGWSDPGDAFRLPTENIYEPDGIFCNDATSQRILQHHYPFPDKKFHLTGTPALDSIELDKAEYYRHEGRSKLGLSEDTWAYLHVGQPNAEKVFGGSDPQIQEKTLEETLKGFAVFASYHPKEKLAFMLRTHPRDPYKEDVINMLQSAQLPPNVSKIVANHPQVSMPEAAFSTEAIGGIHTTELFYGQKRDIPVVFLGYSREGLGLQNLIKNFGQPTLDEIQSTPQTALVKTPEELSQALEKFYSEKNQRQRDLVVVRPNYARRILDLAFAQ